SRAEALERYGNDLLAEAEGLLELVSGAYATFARPGLFEPWVMHYFVAATSLERARRARSDGDDAGFLRLRDPAFRSALAEGGRKIADAAIDSQTFASRVASRLSPWNHEGFCDEAKKGIYRSPRRESERFDRDV